MADELPMFPMHLVSSVTSREQYTIPNADMATDDDINSLMELLFNEPENVFYLIVEEGATLTQPMQLAVDGGAIDFAVTDLHIYAMPNGTYRQIHGDGRRDWQKSAVKDGKKFVRHTLRLTELARRRMTAQEHLSMADAQNANPFEAKPGAYGFSVDLFKLWRCVRMRLASLKKKV